ncbi:hypothetical protein VFMJ11_A1219 [Aliivibrio fischeri MJ11]|uniref:Uncharacterized protein n=1 Tax=Aliivibrio fischeri (strain MJ11) TaxID=388396 RepID=B5EVP6_ALIFM|nr:hypothetical protein VFMJ11_A1219 [Aliivibrio fischeri MJ11]
MKIEAYPFDGCAFFYTRKLQIENKKTDLSIQIDTFNLTKFQQMNKLSSFVTVICICYR